MAVSASFHRNVLLLNQLVPPNDDFKKLFREGMFDKPNIAGFVQVSHYLLTICDAERFKKLVEWPVTCKKTEAKYRNDVRDYLNTISSENPDLGFPRILTTYLHHASGTKFTVIMWKLSQLALRRYIMHEGDYEVAFAPKLGPMSDLVKTYLQQSTMDVASNIRSHHRNCLQIEKAANFALAEDKEELAKIKTELFDRKESMAKCAAAAPVATSIKQRLTNVEDSDVIQMWKSSLDQNVCYIQKRHAILRDLEKMCENVNGIMSNVTNDAKALDGRQLQEINCSRISELPFPPDVQSCLYHLYKDNKLTYHNFIRLFTSILCQVYQWLRKNEPADLAQCALQVEASIEDMKSVSDMFGTFLTSLKDSTQETQGVLCERNAGHLLAGVNALSLAKSVLLMPSPLIKINTNCADVKNDLHKLLQFTPREVAYKSLFSRYTRHNRNRTPDLRTNLFVSRISVDDAMLLGANNEKQGSAIRFMTPRVSHLYKRTTGKYSRLFSAYKNKNVKANCSMLSLPATAQANSSAIVSPNLSDFNLDIAARGFFNLSEESSTSSTSVQCTPVMKRNVSKETRRDTLDRQSKVSKPELDELTEVRFVNDENKGTVVKHEHVPRRRSIGDLVERYKKLLEVSNHTTIKFQNECTEHEAE